MTTILANNASLDGQPTCSLKMSTMHSGLFRYCNAPQMYGSSKHVVKLDTWQLLVSFLAFITIVLVDTLSVVTFSEHFKVAIRFH